MWARLGQISALVKQSQDQTLVNSGRLHGGNIMELGRRVRNVEHLGRLLHVVDNPSLVPTQSSRRSGNRSFCDQTPLTAAARDKQSTLVPEAVRSFVQEHPGPHSPGSGVVCRYGFHFLGAFSLST